MLVSPADYEAFANATGSNYPSTPSEKAKLYPVVADWKAARSAQQRQERGNSALAPVLAGVGVIGLGAAGYGIYKSLRRQGLSEPVAAEIAQQEVVKAKTTPTAPPADPALSVPPADAAPSAPATPPPAPAQSHKPLTKVPKAAEIAQLVSVTPADNAISSADPTALHRASNIQVARDQSGRITSQIGVLFPGSRMGSIAARGRDEYNLKSMWNDANWGPLLHAANTPELQHSLISQVAQYSKGLANKLSNAINVRNGATSLPGGTVKSFAALPDASKAPVDSRYHVYNVDKDTGEVTDEIYVRSGPGSNAKWVQGGPHAARQRIAPTDEAAYDGIIVEDGKGMRHPNFLPFDERGNAFVQVNESDLSSWSPDGTNAYINAGKKNPELEGYLGLYNDDTQKARMVRFQDPELRHILNRPVRWSDLSIPEDPSIDINKLSEDERPSDDTFVKSAIGASNVYPAAVTLQNEAQWPNISIDRVATIAREFNVGTDQLLRAANGDIELRSNSGFKAPHQHAVGGATYDDWLTQVLSAYGVQAPMPSAVTHDLLLSGKRTDRVKAAHSFMRSVPELTEVLASQMPESTGVERLSMVQEALSDAADDYHRAMYWAAANDAELSPRLQPGAKGFPSFDQFARLYVRRHVLGTSAEIRNAGLVAPVVNLPADVSEIITNEALVTKVPIVKIIERRVGNAGSPAEALWKLDGMLSSAASDNLDEPYTTGSKLAERFWDAAPADDSSRVGRLKARLTASTQSRYNQGSTLDGGGSVMPLSIKLGSRLPGASALIEPDQDIADRIIKLSLQPVSATIDGVTREVESHSSNAVLDNARKLHQNRVQTAKKLHDDGQLSDEDYKAVQNKAARKVEAIDAKQASINALRVQGELLISRFNNAASDQGRGFVLDRDGASGRTHVNPDTTVGYTSIDSYVNEDGENTLPVFAPSPDDDSISAKIHRVQGFIHSLDPADPRRHDAEQVLDDLYSERAYDNDVASTLREYNSLVEPARPGELDASIAEMRRLREAREAAAGAADASSRSASNPQLTMRLNDHRVVGSDASPTLKAPDGYGSIVQRLRNRNIIR